LSRRPDSTAEIGVEALVNQLRLPRQHRHNGNALVAVDLAECQTVTARSPEGEQSAVATLKARIETLEAELAKLEGEAAVHRADFERERERFDREPSGANGSLRKDLRRRRN
jgi:hypothetical protein